MLVKQRRLFAKVTLNWNPQAQIKQRHQRQTHHREEQVVEEEAIVARSLVLKVREEPHAHTARPHQRQSRKQECDLINDLRKTNHFRVKIFGNNVELDKDTQKHSYIVDKRTFKRLSDNYTHDSLPF